MFSLESLVKPTSLECCSDVFCENCILSYIRHSTDDKTVCPVCQECFTKDSLHYNEVLEAVTTFVTSILEKFHIYNDTSGKYTFFIKIPNLNNKYIALIVT